MPRRGVLQIPNLREVKEMVVKIIYTCNFLPGKQQEYLEWAQKAVPIFLAPEELKKMSAYQNWLGHSTPMRWVEFEFEDMKAYQKYWAREEIIKVSDEWASITTNQEAKILLLVYEKAK